MSESTQSFLNLLREDPRYTGEAYQFIRDALGFAQEVLKLGESRTEQREECHLTGQELCEAIRLYALEQYGLLAKVVLNSWGLRSTSDFGEVVYNLIRIGRMKKSPSDRREDFDNCYDFDQAFAREFQLVKSSTK